MTIFCIWDGQQPKLCFNVAITCILEAGRYEIGPPDSSRAKVLEPSQSSLSFSELVFGQADYLESFSWIPPSASQNLGGFLGRVYFHDFYLPEWKH